MGLSEEADRIDDGVGLGVVPTEFNIFILYPCTELESIIEDTFLDSRVVLFQGSGSVSILEGLESAYISCYKSVSMVLRGEKVIEDLTPYLIL